MKSHTPRLKGKGHRWKAGQACVSNPENSKFREAARGRFFEKIEGPSGLTQDALEQHNSALGNVSEQMESLNVEEEDLQSAGNTFNTFATNFTSCTVPAFHKFFKNFTVTSEHHTRMLAIHAAAQEYMQEAGMTESNTSYFCSLMISLEGIMESGEDVSAALALMARVARRVPLEVLQSKFGDFAKILDQVITHHQETAIGLLLENAIGCLSILLRAQEREQWTYPYTQNLLLKIFGFTLHAKPKVRKSAQYNTSAILKGSSFIVKEEEELEDMDEETQKTKSKSAILHPAAKFVAEFCVSQLRSSSEMGNTKATLHTLVLIRQIIAHFPKKEIKAVCENILSVMAVGNSLVNITAMQALYNLLVAEPSASVFPAETNVALLNALTQSSGLPGQTVAVVPAMNDPQPANAWITLITVALINLFKLNEELGMRHIALWFQQILPYWKSDHEEVQVKVGQSLSALMEECICMSSSLERHEAQVQIITTQLQGALSFQYQTAWLHVFLTLIQAFNALGKTFPNLLLGSVKELAEFMDNRDLPHRGKVEQAIGAAVKSIGPQKIIEILPIQITGNMNEDEKYLWLLPCMKKYLSETSLVYFETFFVHLASKCYILIDALKKKGQGDSLLAKTYQNIERQIWSLLPSFCDGAIDVDEALANEKFARIVCDHIKFRDDTRVDVMAALRNLINDNKEQPGRLVTYAKNYIPALFNIYLTKNKTAGAKEGEATVENGQRLAAYHTVKVYLTIVPKDKCKEFLSLIMNKYNSEEDAFKKRALMDLSRNFLPYLDIELMQRLYEKVLPLLAQSADKNQQKAAYRMLEEILGVETEARTQFISLKLDDLSELLIKSLSSAAPQARAPRLRCVKIVLAQLTVELSRDKWEPFLRQVVAESVMCLGKQKSTATRKAAFAVITEIGNTIRRLEECSPEDTVRHSLKLLLAGLVGSPSLAGNTILAITALAYTFKDLMPSDMLELLVSNMCVQLVCHTREIVSACLSFIKSILTMFSIQVMSTHVDSIVKALCNMQHDCQRKYRLQTKYLFDKLMRKFGADRIMALVPRDDDILQKRLRNLRKEVSRRQRLAKDNDDAQESDDEDFGNGGPQSIEEILAEIDRDIEDDGESKNKKNKENKTKKKGENKKATYIKETGEDQIVDLLDGGANQAVVSKRPVMKAEHSVSAAKKEELFKTDKSSGKFIITDEDEDLKKDLKAASNKKMEFLDDLDEFLAIKEGAQDGKIKKRKRTFSTGSNDSIEPPMKTSGVSAKGTKGSGAPEKKVVKKKWDYGSEFKSKKAKGDMMLKDKLSPYSYVPLSKDRLNKRKKQKYAGQFSSLVKGAKKGVAKGTKMKGRNSFGSKGKK